jgi:type III pantothenate kinase
VILLVDIGNSRLKYAHLDGERLGSQHFGEYAAWTVEDWRRRLFGGPAVAGVLAATVAGEASETSLRRAAAAAGVESVEFVRSTAAAAGVRSGYDEPTQLGVDRWLALIAAHRHWPGPCCVVDVGTAATVDALAADGTHLGGFIVPGPELMVRSLLRGTSELATRAAQEAGRAEDFFADNTREAIGRGCVLALAALAERAAAELEHRVGAAPRLLVTGGGGESLLPWVRRTAELVPDLVLRGLAVLAGRP